MATKITNLIENLQSYYILSMKSMLKKQLAEELRDTIIRKFEKRKLYSSFMDNIWDSNLADMQLISKFSKSACFL